MWAEKWTIMQATSDSSTAPNASNISQNQDGDSITNDTGKGIFMNKTTTILDKWFHNIPSVIYLASLEI